MSSNYRIIGLMSGTSLDGLDIAYVHFWQESEQWKFTLLKSQSIDYEPIWREKLKNSIHLGALELLELDVNYGKWLGEVSRKFIENHNLKPDFIASHGHTVHHQPKLGVTNQIGYGQEIANISEQPVVCDFRRKDLSLGGQGAPLVPIGDQLLFGEFDYCLNLGGIANISFELEGTRIAFDNGLANMGLNHLMKEVGQEYDPGGKFAAQGNLDPALLAKLKQLPYFKQSYPKSTGYEWFIEEVLPILEASSISLADKLCTMVHHVAQQVARDIQRYKAPQASKTSRLMVAGGGAKNTFLIETLQSYLPEEVEVYLPDPDIIEFKEAIVFALMGLLSKEGKVNCLASVTGASRDSSGGVWYQ